MGYFHPGHLELMRRAKKECAVCVVSIFVNPLQFGPREDLKTYPRDLKRDVALARARDVDLVFAPAVQEMYPNGSLAGVHVKGLSDVLCGVSRSGHFFGVATVVAKLLNIVQPDRMFLGQKDAQQVAVIKRMVSDLNFSVRIRVIPTVREPDGLAMSSRNIYLSSSERMEAVALSRALKMASGMVRSGHLDAGEIISKIKKLLLEETSASIEYISCVSMKDLMPIRRINGPVLFAIAVKFPSVRLIDNILVAPKG
jgi:pantoate--beta-alanine ligase